MVDMAGSAAVGPHLPHLRQTMSIALIVGTELFVINRLDPFCVSNLGILIASHRTP